MRNQGIAGLAEAGLRLVENEEHAAGGITCLLRDTTKHCRMSSCARACRCFLWGFCIVVGLASVEAMLARNTLPYCAKSF